MSDIEIRLFRYFVAVAEERHFAHAALRLKITPPTLTHQIKKLESQLGIKLFVRKGNTLVTLTEAGQRFLGSAREALRQVEEAATIARQAERGEVGHIDLGFMTSVSCGGLLRTWIGEFQRANPAIDIAMRQLVPMAQIAAIIRKELDAGFTRPPHKYPRGVQGFEIYCEPLVLALPSQHPLTRHTNVAPAMLPDEAFVNTTAEREVGFLNDTEIIAKIGNFTPRVVRRDDSLITVLTYVANGYGIAIVPQLMRTINISNVVFRDIAASPVPNTSIAFVYRDDPSPSVKLLIKHMQRHALDNDRAKVPPRTNVVSLKDRK
ncbi:MAG: LysR family transcriptional regulator [Rhizobiales bacterium]|nr:LysR family transcriptional regulator [Hyphomicrobiales bacterium]